MAEREAGQKRNKRADPSFAISAAARTFNPRDISRLTEDEAYHYFVSLRFAANGGKAECPHCGCGACYEYRARRIFKCMDCEKQFSATTKTEFSGRKLSFRQILELIVEFAISAKGKSAIEVSKCLNISYRTAFYRLHALRRSMWRSQEDTIFDTPVEIDGAQFGGHIRPKNVKADRKAHRRFPYRSPKKRVVCIIRERRPGGRTRFVIGRTEHEAAKLMPKFIKPGTLIYADMGTAFHFLKQEYPMRRINHSKEYWTPEASTNNAECHFSMCRRSAFGVYHRIAGKYLGAYMAEICWRQDLRRWDTKRVFEDLCWWAMGPFERLPTPPIAPVVQEVIRKSFRDYRFTSTNQPPRCLNDGPAAGQMGELASTMLAALGKRRSAAIAQRAEAKTKCKIEDLNREIRKLDKGIATFIVRRNKSAWKSGKCGGGGQRRMDRRGV